MWVSEQTEGIRSEEWPSIKTTPKLIEAYIRIVSSWLQAEKKNAGLSVNQNQCPRIQVYISSTMAYFLYVCCQSYQSNVHYLSSWPPTMAKAIVSVTGAEARRRTIALYYLMNIIYSRHICRKIMTAHFRNFYRSPLNLKGTMENWGPSLNPFK